MPTTTWIARSAVWDVADFSARYGIDPANTWRVGEAGLLGRPHHDSGFNLLAAEAEDSEAHLQALQRFLSEHSIAMRELQRQGIPQFLNSGIFVDVQRNVMGATSFPAPLLQLLADFGLELCLNAYVCSPADPTSE